MNKPLRSLAALAGLALASAIACAEGTSKRPVRGGGPMRLDKRENFLHGDALHD